MSLSPSVWHSTGETSLEVYLLGVVDYDAAMFLQERFVEEVRARTDRQSVLILCEHPPTATIGREAEPVCFSEIHEDLRRRGVEIRAVNRGGGALVHAPGQLALYPVVPLDRCGWGLLEFRERIEQSLIHAFSELHVPAWTDMDRAGIWCRGGRVAETGLAVRLGTSSHGLFVNVCEWRDWLSQSARRLAGRVPLTTLAAQRSRPVLMGLVRETVLRHLAAGLDCPRFHVYTGHPLLRRTKREVAYA